MKTTKEELTLLHNALEEIENLAAPRRIDLISAIVGMGVVEFASLGALKMSAVVSATLQLKQIEQLGSGDVNDTQLGDSDNSTGAPTDYSRR